MKVIKVKVGSFEIGNPNDYCCVGLPAGVA